ncbi:MAG: class I SAM-dependent methyltransferase [Pseudomonadota bacterium]
MLTVRFEYLDLAPGAWVLDLGCGEGRHVHGLHMLGTVNVVGADLDQPSLDKAEQGLQTLPDYPRQGPLVTRLDQVDALQLPYDRASFDAVICSEVLEHIGPYTAVLAEIRRVLKPEGRLCVSVPRGWPERLCWRLAPPPDGYAYEPGGHLRIFDPVDLRISIEHCGFAYRRRHHAHALHSPYWWLQCLFWKDRERHPLVRAYHRFLVWDLLQRPWLTRLLEAVLNPVLGKSLVLYYGPRSARR